VNAVIIAIAVAGAVTRETWCCSQNCGPRKTFKT